MSNTNTDSSDSIILMGESHTVKLNTVPETPDYKIKKRKILQELTQAQVTIPET